MRIPELQVAVPVRAAADRQAEALSDPRESPLGAGGVARVTHLEAVETLLLELAGLAPRAGGAGGGGGGGAPDGGRPLGGPPQRRGGAFSGTGPRPAPESGQGPRSCRPHPP